MAIIRNLVVKISADISSLSSSLTTAQKNLESLSRSITSIGSDLTKSITVPLAGLGTAAVKTTAEFEQAMANAASVAGASSSELERMTTLARQMGAETVYSASDAADALYYMASAGYKVDQMEASLQSTLNLASATQNDLAFTTDTVIAALNMFGLEASDAERVTNVYASAIGNSMASLSKLSESMTYVGPVANSLGYSIEEVTGALGVLYDSGYEGSTAGTVLRQSLVNLMNPTSAALAVFEELGLAYEDLNPATNDFATIVDRLGEAGMTTAQAMEVFGARGGPGMLALLSQGGDAIRELTSEITGTDAATEMAAMQLDTLTGQWKILKSQLEEIAIMFGNVLIPMIRDFISNYITPLTEKLMTLSDEQIEQIIKIAAIAAAIGPLILAIGKVISLISKIMKVGALLTSTGGMIVAAIAAVAAALVYLYATNEDFRDKVTAIWEKVKSIVLSTLEGIKTWWNQNGDAIMQSVATAMNFIADVVLTALNQVAEVFNLIMPAIRDVVQATITAVSSWWQAHGEQVTRIVTQLWNTISGVLGTVLQTVSTAIAKLVSYLGPLWENIVGLAGDIFAIVLDLVNDLEPLFDAICAALGLILSIANGVISGIISALGPLLNAVVSVIRTVIEILQALGALLRGDFSDAWEHAKTAASHVVSAIKSLVEGFLNFFKGFASGFISMVSSLLNSIGVSLNSILSAIQKFGQSISTWGSNLWSKITTWISNVYSKVKDLINTIWSAVTSFFSNLVSRFTSIASSILSGVRSNLNNVYSSITSAFSTINTYFNNLGRNAYNWGKNLILNIINGIKAMWSSLKSTVSSVASTISNYLGFGSPTKEGPGHTADEWIPNLINMFEKDLYLALPDISKATAAVASALNPYGSVNAVVGEGTSPFGDLLNGLLMGTSGMQMQTSDEKEIVLQIDGTTFARLIAPKLKKEYRRNGIILQEA